jgi:hypothetical protein
MAFEEGKTALRRIHQQIQGNDYLIHDGKSWRTISANPFPNKSRNFTREPNL